jgi:hypothetical protein
MRSPACGYLEAVSRCAPLLVVLDDVHRGDGETLAILADVTADLAVSKILVLASYRPAEVSEQLSGCLATLAAREPARLTLGGLDAAAARELIRAICTRPVDGETARVIAERTGGNPFFIRETARLLDSEGALAATTEVAAGVREVLQRRIARLPARRPDSQRPRPPPGPARRGSPLQARAHHSRAGARPAVARSRYQTPGLAAPGLCRRRIKGSREWPRHGG